MDVTYTNVLQGARQYFQGVPAASTAPPTPPTRPSLHYTSSNHQQAPQQQQPPPLPLPQHTSVVTTYSNNYNNNQPQTNGNYHGHYNYDGGYNAQQAGAYSTAQTAPAAYHELKTPKQQQQQQQQQQQYPVSSAPPQSQQYYYNHYANSRAPQQQYVSPTTSTAAANNTYAAATSTAVAAQQANYQQQFYQQKQYVAPAATVPVPSVVPTAVAVNTNHNSHVSAAYLDKTKAYGGAIRPPLNHVPPQQSYHHVPEESRAPHYATNNPPVGDYMYSHQQSNVPSSASSPSPAQLVATPQHRQHTASTDSRYIDNRQHHLVYDNRLVASDTRSIPADNRFPNMRQAAEQPTQQTNISLDYRIITTDNAAKLHKPSQSLPDSNKQMYEPTSKIGIVPRQKRESPLDLSVKTVKTTADSTLDDAASEESKRMYSYGNRYVESPLGQVQHPQQQHQRWNNANIVPQDYTAKISHFPNIARAPKVDFSPNFNMPNNSTDTAQPSNNVQYSPTTNYNRNMNYNMPPQQYPQQPPRSEIPAPPRKRAMSGINSGIPNKAMKPQQTDTWRQTIDQQIDQRISSYTKDQSKHNGHHAVTSNSAPPKPPTVPDYKYHNYNVTNAKSIVNTQYGPHNIAMFQTENQKRNYQQYLESKGNLNANSTGNGETPPRNAATKEVLNLLRNSLQVKEQREAKKKLEQQQQQQQQHHHPQEPSKHHAPYNNSKYANYPLPTPVPVHQPYPPNNYRQSSAPPTPEKHNLPVRAIERPVYNRLAVPLSSSESNKPFRREEPIVTNSAPPNQNNDLDGLAAFLAARIRTKGELKQVSSSQYDQNSTNSNNNLSSVDSTATQIVVETVNRNNDSIEPKSDPVVANKITKANQDSGMRSSTETSVFDFPDSDNEIEMPVLERRQSLLEMRKDRKLSITKQEPVAPVAERPLSALDLKFNEACDSFLEQLKFHTTPKKRGRKKKIVDSPKEAANVSIRSAGVKQEIVMETDEDDDDEEDKPLVAIIKSESKAKLSDTIDNKSVIETSKSEKPDVETKKPEEAALKEFSKIPVIIVEDINRDKVQATKKSTESVVRKSSELKLAKKTIISKYDSSSDSDIPLINCKFKLESMQRKKRKRFKRPNGAKHSDGSCSDSELESTKISASLKNAVKLQCVNALKPNETNKVTKIKVEDLIALSFIGKPGKKPLFGDGSQFHSGWEEELLKYKQSIRIPSMLIHVTQPTRCNRLSTSLPDLDPCPLSPANSSIAESRVKPEPIDSDIDSNCSYTFSLSKTNYDSEGSSSVKSLKSNLSILDRLLEKCGGRKRRKYRRHDDGIPKLTPKSENTLELLPTPGLEPSSKKETSVLLGFRKETVENFKEAFIQSANVNISTQFSTVVLKSRTRTETRVLKEKATIREVFGEDRPASAPPVTCLDELKSSDVNDDSTSKKFLANVFFDDIKESPVIEIKSELLDDDKDKDSISTLLSLTCNEKKRTKLRNMRRKFSSGFDYIRKKKKQIKKEEVAGNVGIATALNKDDSSENNVTPVKQRRGFVSSKATPETAEDIAKEIKMWVPNKGVGETHLHRTARLGLTDVTAYCLEESKCFPSPKDNAGYTPLHEACARGHLDIARLLLLYGANVSESAQGGIRPLHEAAENGFVEIIRLLLSYGADPTLATYSGQTPLSLATDDATIDVLQNHMLDLQGKPTVCWTFNGPSKIFDPANSGYDPLLPTPEPTPRQRRRSTPTVHYLGEDSGSDLDLQMEVSEHMLPNLYTLQPDQPTTDRWILLHDLSNTLKIKSRDTLLRQLGGTGGGAGTGGSKASSATTRHQASVAGTSTSTSTTSGVITIAQLSEQNLVREMKMADFLDQAHCCQFLNANEKLPVRASKVLLVRYTDKVRELLNVEQCVITSGNVTDAR